MTNLATSTTLTRETPSKSDQRSMQLGKRAAVHDVRTLLLGKYLNAQVLPLPPDSTDYAKTIGPKSWGMMENDKIGDCTCAAAGHLIEMWTKDATGTMRQVSDDDILAAYSDITGYNPKTGANDTGAVELDVLKFWRDKGIAKDTITAFTGLEPQNHYQIQQAVYIFGGCYIGLQLPVSAQNQPIWTVPQGGAVGPGAPGSWGGHAVPVVAYDKAGLTVVTWGALQKMTWTFWDTYCDEAYAIVSNDFVNNQKTPAGFDLQTLLADLKVITG